MCLAGHIYSSRAIGSMLRGFGYIYRNKLWQTFSGFFYVLYSSQYRAGHFKLHVDGSNEILSVDL